MSHVLSESAAGKLLVAPRLAEALPGTSDVGFFTYVGAEVLTSLSGDAPDLSEALQRLSHPEQRTLLFLRPALALAAAMVVVRERVSLLSTFKRLRDCFCLDALLAMPLSTIAALARLELSELGHASDLCSFPEAPREWTWLRWRTGADTLSVVSRGQHIAVRRLRPEPRMAYLNGFLSGDECAHIIQLGIDGGALHPSRVVKHDRKEGEEGGERTNARTSESCRVSAAQDVVVRRAVQRAAYLAGVGADHAEAVQVVHYRTSQQYRPHYDFFQPSDSRYAERCREQGNRLISVFAYLSPCAGGGRTCFPNLGTSFTPEVGCAVVWYNIDRHGVPDERTLHAGEPVTSGDKWGLNVWLRERPRKPSAKLSKAVRVSLSLVDPADVSDGGTAGPVRLQLSTSSPAAPSAVTACPLCGDLRGPLGLCLCRDAYVV